uniref:Uncharacterized protein n=1 Tax=Anguilla anguilla TaxID=7936 RepID=A0A0E9V923_ANGAN
MFIHRSLPFCSKMYIIWQLLSSAGKGIHQSRFLYRLGFHCQTLRAYRYVRKISPGRTVSAIMELMDS